MQYAQINGQGIESEHFHRRIHCRSGHVAVEYRGHMLVWAGFQEHANGYQSNYHDTDEILLYNNFTEVWSRILTTGTIPPKNSGSCGVILDHYLYVFGGFQENFNQWEENNVNNLYRLNLRDLNWEKLNPTGVNPVAADKLVGWTYRGKVYYFGGYGPFPDNPLNLPFQYVPGVDDNRPRGWNNQLLCYDPDRNEFSWPQTKGPTPAPRAAHAGDITGNKFYLFGGRLQDNRMRSLHCLNLDTMEWSPNLIAPDQIGPEGRSWHSFTFVNETTAIVYGGFSQQSMILSDSWQLKLPDHKWTPLHPHTPAPRLWHQGVYLPSARTLVLVGGHKTSVFAAHGQREHADCLLKLNFEPKSLVRLCLNSAVENFQQTSPEWGTLPAVLRDILHYRLEQVN